MEAPESSAEITVRLVGAFLVDGDGRLLLQHRDGNTPAYPNRWTIPIGTIETGETPGAAVRREVKEETGLDVDDLRPVGRLVIPRYDPTLGLAEWFLFCAATSARQEDVICGEGQAMVFTAPADALVLDLTLPMTRILRPFLESDTYRKLARPGA